LIGQLQGIVHESEFPEDVCSITLEAVAASLENCINAALSGYYQYN